MKLAHFLFVMLAIGYTSAAYVGLTTGPSSLGKILIHAESGRTLYYFTHDAPNQQSTCNGACTNIWPPLIGIPLNDASLSGVAGVKARADGTIQATYNGMPLYFYHLDMTAGDTLGENVNNAWYVFRENVIKFTQIAQSLFTVDQNGRSIYYNGADRPNLPPMCNSDACASIFPPVLGFAKQDAASSISNAVGFIQRANGQFQVTLNGYPLHYYYGDSAAGQFNGDNKNGFFVYNHMVLHSGIVNTGTGGATPLQVQLCGGAAYCQFENSCFKNETYIDASGQAVTKVYCMILNRGLPAPHLDLRFLNLDSNTLQITGLQQTYANSPIWDFFPSRANSPLQTNQGHPWSYTIKAGGGGLTLRVLVDSRSMTLYQFLNDIIGQPSVCLDNTQCTNTWPPLAGFPHSQLNMNLGGTLGTQARQGGRLQPTFNGKPLYYYSKDMKPGDALGQGIGGVWSVVNTI
ncbi:hypothetical protein SAMD00019534_006610 [Acytostelium subglobosum LB1]|uniref:hypothetical protein n=1 Tax=Acytostelium subglobosum LB1 TaxID=1410327 RepID=UPI0006449A4B|nr:hypothetical protein SAMD00019534_006610 [Acytostelium subglobosum LB1]GAM17486.1 hypothetical protein SAMD00019534_006610 [Acytostelium subglobosum LB1]|eukprot:XP_012759548.1 hypothetical protein SAMD00019534_006610 [Acytostelium subglobosum LB1]